MKGRNSSNRLPSGPGDRIGAFTLLPFRGGRPVTYEPRRSGVTVLSFCALWCDTWREQSARLAAVRRRLTGLPIHYLTLSVDGRWAERYRDGASADADVLLDVGGQVSEGLGLRAVPWTLVVDASGTIRFARQGIVRTEELESLLRRLVTRGSASTVATPEENTVFLTFDDFPAVPPGARLSPDEELLDILRASGVAATLFCVGEHLQTPAGADVARRAAREGHALQMHGWDHDARQPGLERCRRVLQEITGIAPALYRPPGSTALLRANSVTAAEPKRPTIAPYDHLRPGAAELTRRVLFAVRPGAIIQLHAGVAQTRETLPTLITALRRRGLAFAVLQ